MAADKMSFTASSNILDDNQHIHLYALQRRTMVLAANKPGASPCTSQHPRFAVPPLAVFLADFTLGFADGLTVPFALTAGLSSLGQTDTVIYAGMAEICAGSI